MNRILHLSDRCQVAPNPGSSYTGCLHPKLCAQQAEHLQRQQEVFRPLVSKVHEDFLVHVPHSIMANEHAVERMSERGISYDDVVAAVECCEPIEGYDRELSHPSVTLFGDPGFAGGNRFRKDRFLLLFKGESLDSQPLIVVCYLPERPAAGRSWELHVGTVYDPDPVRWNKDFTQRTCFCFCVERQARVAHSAPVSSRLVYSTGPVM